MTIQEIKKRLKNNETFEFLATKTGCPTCDVLKNSLKARNIELPIYVFDRNDAIPYRLIEMVQAFPTFVTINNGIVNMKLNPGVDVIDKHCA